MNKTIFRKQKVLLVISILFVIISAFNSISVNNDVDYDLLNQTIERTKNKNSGKIILLKESNNNEFVISIIKDLNHFEEIDEKIKLDSLKKSIGIDSNKKFNLIFNKNEYSNFISQENNSKWDFNRINNATAYIENKNIKATNNNNILYVSKPIYTKNNNFALVYISSNNHSYIDVFEKINKKWIEYKLIYPMISVKKITVKE